MSFYEEQVVDVIFSLGEKIDDIIDAARENGDTDLRSIKYKIKESVDAAIRSVKGEIV